jgi:hypothetical protein
MHLNKPGARFPTTVMEYPETVTEILESWDARAEQWYLIQETLHYDRCWSSFRLVSITR